MEVTEEGFLELLPKAVNYAIRIRKHLDDFHSHVYNEGPLKKIGYGFDLNHGISEANAVALVRERFRDMGQALMARAFETSLAADPARFSVFVEIAERAGEQAVLQENAMWEAAKRKDYWGLNEAFLTSPLINAYGPGREGRSRVAYLGRVLVEGQVSV